MVRRIGLAALLVVAVLYYYAFGPGPTPSELGDLAWWRPRGWALRGSLLAPLRQFREAEGILRLLPTALFSLPVVALSAWLATRFRSAASRAGIVALAGACVAFTYYGYLAEGIWRFFSWRLPAATLSFSLLLAALLFAPSLLRAALGLPRVWRSLALAAPFALSYVLSTEITGTNPELSLNVSPWPVLTLFGLLLLGYSSAVWHLAAGVGLWLWSRRPGTAGALLALVAAAGVGAIGGRAIFEQAGAAAAVGFAVISAAYAGIVGLRSGYRAGSGLARVAAGVLVALAVFLSNLAATREQGIARDEKAASVIDALERYRQANAAYPEELAQLVPDFLGEVPRPRMGLYPNADEQFTYSNFGDSYNLEFASVLWVQCAYSPAYVESAEAGDWDAAAQTDLAEGDPNDEGEDPNDGGAEPADEGQDTDEAAATPEVASGEVDGDDVLQASWSCDSKPPEIW